MIKSLNPLQRRTLLMAIGAFCLPIKLSFAYAAFIPLISWWLIGYFQGKNPLFGSSAYVSAPLFFYLAALAISSLFGLNPEKSLPNIAAATFMALLVPVYGSIASERTSIVILAALIAGQTIASIDSVFALLNIDLTKKFFVGEVTESGQLAMTIPTIFGVLYYLTAAAKEEKPRLFSPKHIQEIVSVATVILLLISCSGKTLQLSNRAITVLYTATALVFSSALAYIWLQRKKGCSFPTILFSSITLIALPLTLTALIGNLKRGPWAGVMVGLMCYFLTYRPRTIIPVLAIAVFSFMTFSPVRERILSAREHFFISGGRSEIWDIGAELVTTYPTGIGFRNSAILGKFSTDIPDNLRHFHSNPINIAVESGALGFLLFYWWIARCVICAFRYCNEKGAHHGIAMGIACALISWQTAGLVEFNAGDSEVLLMAYMLAGILGALVTHPAHAAADEFLHSAHVSRVANGL